MMCAMDERECSWTAGSALKNMRNPVTQMRLFRNFKLQIPSKIESQNAQYISCFMLLEILWYLCYSQDLL
jgi:hypothetical protein